MADLVVVEKLSEFSPPGYPVVDDGLTQEQRQGWSEKISEWMNMEITAKQPNGQPLPGPGGLPRTPLTQFFNGTVTAYETDQKPVSITWTAFPNLVRVRNPHEPKRWAVADADRNNQDEYLEWSLLRDAQKRIITVTYTCEAPEYWEYLAETKPSMVSSLYRSMNPLFKDKMKTSDWFGPDGAYRLDNKWNNSTTSGAIAHLMQPNNTLTAEIDIAAQGTVIRKDGRGNIITDKAKLINCSAYGVAQRNSDPTIGDAINGLTRQGISVSIANPVALYIHSFNTANFQLDIEGTGENMVAIPAGTFHWQRGDVAKNMGLRLQVQIPDGIVGTGDSNKGRQLTVSDIVDTSNGQNIAYGAQFADYIRMTVKGVGIPGGVPAAPLPCPGRTALAATATATATATAAAAAVAADAHVLAAESIADTTPCDASANTRRLGTRW